MGGVFTAATACNHTAQNLRACWNLCYQQNLSGIWTILEIGSTLKQTDLWLCWCFRPQVLLSGQFLKNRRCKSGLRPIGPPWNNCLGSGHQLNNLLLSVADVMNPWPKLRRTSVVVSWEEQEWFRVDGQTFELCQLFAVLILWVHHNHLSSRRQPAVQLGKTKCQGYECTWMYGSDAMKQERLALSEKVVDLGFMVPKFHQSFYDHGKLW